MKVRARFIIRNSIVNCLLVAACSFFFQVASLHSREELSGATIRRGARKQYCKHSACFPSGLKGGDENKGKRKTKKKTTTASGAPHQCCCFCLLVSLGVDGIFLSSPGGCCAAMTLP